MSLSLGLPKDDYKNHVFLSPQPTLFALQININFLPIDKFVQKPEAIESKTTWGLYHGWVPYSNDE